MSTPAYTNSAVTNLDVKDRTSYGVGLSYEWIWGPYFSLQPEIDWVTKGYRVTYDSSVATGVMETLSASYLDVPVTFKARYPLSSVTPYFGFQLLLSLLMSSTLELESQGIRTESDATALMSGSDFGTGFLGGIEIFASRRVSFFFELRYHQTFGDFLVSETTGASNRLFRVVFGPRFDAF